MYKRYIVEIGTGLDLHGMDVTKAAKKAVKDAVSHSCLCGITEVLGLKNPADHARIILKIASPFPERVDVVEVASVVPFGTVEADVERGGMAVKGLSVPVLGEGDTIVVVNAALTVYVDTDT